MELSELLGAELFTQVSAKVGDHQLLVFDKGVKVLVDDGSLIPKYRLDEVIAGRDAATKLVDQHEKEIKDLKKKAEGNTELVKQIEDYQATIKTQKAEAEKEGARIKKQFTLKESLMNSGVADQDARDLLAAKFDLEKIEVGEDGKIKGFDEMLKPIKENKVLATLFGTTRIVGQEHIQGDVPDAELGEYAKKNPFSPATLNIATQVELQKKNPELANKLRSLAQV